MERGGKRENSGRTTLRGAVKVVTTINVTPELKDYFEQCESSQSEVIESAIRRTKDFKDWKRGNK